MTRTLVVDDAPVLRQLVRMVLEADGSFQVVAEAGDGVEAIEAAREHQPDLILLDVAMPRMDGLEALPHLRRVAPGARVAVFTGYPDPGVAESARAAGAARVLHKGLDPHSLCRELEDLMAQPAPGPTAPRRARTHRPRPGTRGRTPMRIPLPVAVVLVVALLLVLYATLVGIASPSLHPAHYAGAFEEASFREPDLAAEPVAAVLEDGGYTVVVPTLHLRWSVAADGTVAMTGSSPWPEARAAFTQWYEARGLGVPTFSALRVTTPDGAVLDDRSGLLPA